MTHQDPRFSVSSGHAACTFSFLQLRLQTEDKAENDLEDNVINPRFDLDVSINPETNLETIPEGVILLIVKV